MNLQQVYLILFIFFLVTTLLFFTYCLIYYLKYRKSLNQDLAILIDKSDRFTIIETGSTIGKRKLTYKNKEYYYTSDCSLLNPNGKSLYIFSEGKPNPMNISHNKSEWLDSESLRAIMNNDLIRQMIETSNPMKDNFLMIGAFCGIIAAICSAVTLAKVMGLF